MTDCKLKQEIKDILKTGHQMWLHESDLDLKVEELHTLFDRELIKKKLEHNSLIEIKIERRGLGSDAK